MNFSYKYIFSKFISIFITVVGVSLIAFFILHLSPGDPVRIMLGQSASEESIIAMRSRLNLDRPIYIQYLSWIRNITRGDFGISIRYNIQVIELISTRIGITLLLTGSGILISLIGGLFTGVLSALKSNTWIDYLCTVETMFWISVPSFWTGILLLYFFGLRLRWFPIQGMTGIRSLILPALSLGLGQQAWFAKPMRSEMLDVINQDYIKAAKAKGVKNSLIIFKHAMRNALIPIVTMLALRLPWIIGGSIVIEKVFGWNGMGTLLIDSVFARDFPVVQGILLFISIAVIVANLFADLLYSVVDPRIRVE
jgi:peptide/nickel transport system permease protein